MRSVLFAGRAPSIHEIRRVLQTDVVEMLGMMMLTLMCMHGRAASAERQDLLWELTILSNEELCGWMSRII